MNRTAENELANYEKICKATNGGALYASDLYNVITAARQEAIRTEQRTQQACSYMDIAFNAACIGLEYGISIGYRLGVRHQKKAKKAARKLHRGKGNGKDKEC